MSAANVREHRSPQGEKRKATNNKESTPIARWEREAQRKRKNAVKTDVLKQRIFICRKVDSDTFFQMVVGGGFEPPKAMLADLQSAPFSHSGIPPVSLLNILPEYQFYNCIKKFFDIIPFRTGLS